MRHVLLLFAVALTPAVAAQDAPEWLAFFPDEVGDTWVYYASIQECTRTPVTCTTTQGEFTFQVVDRMELDGRLVPVWQGPGGRAAYDVDPADTTVVYVVLEALDNGLPITPNRECIEWVVQIAGQAYIDDVEIGDRTYTLREIGYNCPPATHYAEGVGLTYSYQTENHGGGGSASELWRLVGATVGGHTFGALATSGDDGPRSVHALRLGPNPTSGRVTVRVALGEAADLRLDVADVLGRVVQSSSHAVQAGPASVGLDLATLPAGVYVVRASARGEVVGTTPVTVGR